MNESEEIQKSIEQFAEESMQYKQEIKQIEEKRNELAQERNIKKRANIEEYKPEIDALGKQISELGKRSQEVQNKLDKKYYKVRETTNLMVDNLITEKIRKVRKIDDQREELENKVSFQLERKNKYELQKQYFYERFGRMPELSEQAQKENEIQDKKCEIYKEQIKQIEKKIDEEENNLVHLVDIKTALKTGEYSNIFDANDDEIEIDEIREIGEVQIEPFEKVEEIKVEPFEAVEEIQIEEFDPIEELAKTIVEQIVTEQTKEINERREEQEIVFFKKNKEQDKIVEEDAKILGIFVKIEENEIVYKAQISNGDEIKIYPLRISQEKYVQEDKKVREDIKNMLEKYALTEYKTFDRSVMKKIDPVICDILNKFSEKNNYNSKELIYNYAMSFSRKTLIEMDIAPITYNFSYIKSVEFSKIERKIISKICRNAAKNNNIDVIGNIDTFNRIKIFFKKILMINDVDTLTEGKY